MTCSARLETSFDAQRRFVANASHELRTPLTVERTLLQVALADPDASAETLRATCEELLAAGRDQERLIEALLTLASSERGLELRDRTDIGALAMPIVERPRPELDRHQIELETHLEPAITEGDPALIERLISNLVDNAVRHNVDGGRVEVSTRQQGDRALLIVENTGQLIAPEEIETMFEPFRRLGPARTGTDQGQHGLGLSIVRAIADAHGAEIDARPRPGGGLSITVAFPAPGPAAPPRATTSTAPLTHVRAGQPGREADGQAAQPVAEAELEHALGVAVVRDQLVGARVRDLDLDAVDARNAASLEDAPDAAGLVGTAVGAEHVLALRHEQRARLVLGADRRDGVALDAQQLLDRQLGLRVGALAEVVFEQELIAVEQIARRPADVLVLLPDLVVDVDHDRVLDAEALDGGGHGVRVLRRLEPGRMNADHAQSEPA